MLVFFWYRHIHVGPSLSRRGKGDWPIYARIEGPQILKLAFGSRQPVSIWQKKQATLPSDRTVGARQKVIGPASPRSGHRRSQLQIDRSAARRKKGKLITDSHFARPPVHLVREARLGGVSIWQIRQPPPKNIRSCVFVSSFSSKFQHWVICLNSCASNRHRIVQRTNRQITFQGIHVLLILFDAILPNVYVSNSS
jgi:hypothetical protein